MLYEALRGLKMLEVLELVGAGNSTTEATAGVSWLHSLGAEKEALSDFKMSLLRLMRCKSNGLSSMLVCLARSPTGGTRWK